MMKRAAIGLAICILGASFPVLGMSNYDDPRLVLSYMDKSLDGARDILRLAITVRGETHLVFEVKTRASEEEPQAQDFVLLQVSQDDTRHLLVPIDPALGDAVLDYEAESPLKPREAGFAGSRLRVAPGDDVFRARRVPLGVEFLVPLAWIDYREKVAFDAFTIRGRASGTGFLIDEVYDQAGKGRREERRISAITLLNNLCATRRK